MVETSFSLKGQDTTLAPAEIEQELAALWAGADLGGSVSRVVLGNVIWMGNSEYTRLYEPVFRDLMAKYPCRLFVVEIDESSGDEEIHASVNAHCHRASKGELPVCCEVITLAMSPKSMAHLRGCLLPLLLSDLQTVVASAIAPGQYDAVEAVEREVDRVIRLISASPDPVAALQRMVEEEIESCDLSWFRMADIREQTAAFFDDPTLEFDLTRLESISVSISSDKENRLLPELLASMYVGWLGSKLGWKPDGGNVKHFNFEGENGPVKIRFQWPSEQAEHCEGGSHLNTIILKDQDGATLTIALGRREHGMDMVCESKDHANSERHPTLTELPPAEALGLALNSPASGADFKKAAALAAPVLKHFMPE